MKIVRVQYTTTPAFAKQNMENIRGIVSELKQLNHPGIRYSTFVMDDGITFMHFDQFVNEEAHLALQQLASFKKFAGELDAAGFESVPVLDLLEQVATTEKPF